MPIYSFHCLVVSSDFDLVFSEASVSRYVVMRIQENLRYLTTCLWIRSADKRNYGTIFSYAADSNWLGSHSGNDFTLYDYGGLQVKFLFNIHVKQLFIF